MPITSVNPILAAAAAQAVERDLVLQPGTVIDALVLKQLDANLVRIGRTSITVHLEAWVLRRKEMQSILVTDGNFTYVSIDDHGQPQVIQRDERPISA